jgi:hypothetical protein
MAWNEIHGGEDRFIRNTLVTQALYHARAGAL